MLKTEEFHGVHLKSSTFQSICQTFKTLSVCTILKSWKTVIKMWVAKSGRARTINRKTALVDFQNSESIHFQTAYPVLSSSCLASLSLQANSSLKAVSCWVLKDLFCFLCSSKYDSSVYIGFTYFCTGGRNTVSRDKCQKNAGDNGEEIFKI